MFARSAASALNASFSRLSVRAAPIASTSRVVLPAASPIAFHPAVRSFSSTLPVQKSTVGQGESPRRAGQA